MTNSTFSFPEKVLSYTPTTANITWTPPTETGGREITGYYIERREIGSDWIRVNNYPCPTLNYTVPGLRDGGRYEFRSAVYLLAFIILFTFICLLLTG